MKDNKIIEGVHHWATWWIRQRRKKLIDELSGTMSLNPFIVPFLFDYHNLNSIEEFVDLFLASHLMIGHNTGFGKLIDEKILPEVFGTIKLDKNYRQLNPPLENSAFNEIDHIVRREDGETELLSLKAGKWTIQLSMAIQLNRSFSDILKYYSSYYNKIVVGVYYGKNEELTDKYDILRGINRGAVHHVKDITHNVKIYAGQNFWSWLGNGKENTQYLVLEGITSAIEEVQIKKDNKILMDKFKKTISNQFKDTLGIDSPNKWKLLLEKINNGQSM
ncbi:PmeII family type II restriction endonuclease [Flavilitoribacter nigricans]|uniref:Restriction endonuclease n=1 Tax=Flavilitoribacter nigricans (strain ATCC 23147 / DSM 23189 / NBRC 102662 / NCIMB 1420 / SS-2) TaxID=1122177 RepID=A0A2D0N772_FLAN2|nr:PmeII family type II restriction endonuclease [Flavilitoribacter nigricans]PHN04230.1 restriction endonuclease [Flavilitoribacter nigricans DSM 23189 = NBRC 102662]